MNQNTSLKKVRLFAASPGDVANERARLATVVEELQPLAEHVGVTLEFMDWTKVAPDLGRPEQVILDQLKPTTWDIFIGILWRRFGSPTGAIDARTGQDILSGTEEEFREAYALWEQQKRPRVMVFRCMRAIPPNDLDLDQYKRIQTFFSGFAPSGDNPGLYKEFDTSEAFERLVRQHLQNYLLDYSEQKGHTLSLQEVQALAPRVPDNLPRQLPFFGRKEEIAQAMRALSQEDRGGGLVIDGIGGIGKTALAVEIAYLCKESGRFDAYILVTAKQDRLEPSGIQELMLKADTLDGLLNDVARAFGQPGIAQLASGEEKQLALLDALRERHTLLLRQSRDADTPGAECHR